MKFRTLLAAASLALALFFAPANAPAQTRTFTTYMGAYSSGTTYHVNDMVTSAGSTYVSLIANNTGNTPASNPSDWAAIGGSGGGGGLAPVVKLFGFGDSYIYGAGATSSATGVFELLSRDTPAPASNFAVVGTTTDQIALEAFSYFAPFPTAKSVSLMDGGANDATNDTCGGVSPSACITNYENSLQATEAWLTIPYNFRQMASAATASGAWGTDYVPNILNTPYLSPGTPMSTTASGATLTFNLPSSSSPVIGITYYVVNGQTGSFTVAIDGTLRTNDCSATTTFSSAPCTAELGPSFFRQEYVVTPGGTHTVVITSTAASLSDIVSVDWIPPTGTANENAVFVAGIDTDFTNNAIYDTASKAIVTQLHADGLPVYFVDLQHGTPGTNGTTDTSIVATATCPASLITRHPNDCGYANFLATINNTETSAGFVFSSYQSGGQNVALSGQFYVPARLFTQVGASLPRSAAYASFIDTTTNERGLDYYINGYAFGAGAGYDTASGSAPFLGQFMTRDYGSFGWHCFQTYDNSGLIGMSHYSNKNCISFVDGSQYNLGSSTAKYFSALEGTAISSAATIAPAYGVTHITGTASITTITPPANCITGTSCQITLIPDGIWATNTSGNIALASTAVVSRPLILIYDFGASKWYPSY